MSVAASRYAIDWARAVPRGELAPGARAVLGFLAASADYRTNEGYTGEWLAEAAGMNDRNMRRHVRRLTELGAFTVEHRDGLANVVRFPIGAVLAAAPAEGRTDAGGAWHPAICRCPECAELAAEG